jgi:hypothetical protein
MTPRLVFLLGVLVGPWLWAGAFALICALVALFRMVRHIGAARSNLQRSRLPVDKLGPADDLDVRVIRALGQDMDLEMRYPWLTPEQRLAIVRRRRQETRP